MNDNTSSAALSRQTNVIAHSQEIVDETPALSYALTATLTHQRMRLLSLEIEQQPALHADYLID